MKRRHEFLLHRVGRVAGVFAVDPTLQLLGAQGWSIAGLTPDGDGLVVALQRELSDERELPDDVSLSAALQEPLTAPPPAILDELDER